MGVTQSLEIEPGSKEENLCQSSEKESVANEEDGAEIPKREPLNEEEGVAQNSQTDTERS